MIEEIQKTDSRSQAAGKLAVFTDTETLKMVAFESYYLITNAAEVKTQRPTRTGTKAELIEYIYE